eukprot:3044773-Prymnesium_polylepis.1
MTRACCRPLRAQAPSSWRSADSLPPWPIQVPESSDEEDDDEEEEYGGVAEGEEGEESEEEGEDDEDD